MNLVILFGTLAEEPELKETKSGAKFCNFSLNVVGKKRSKDGTYSDETTFIPKITVWGKTAEKLTSEAIIGEPILVEAKITSREYESKHYIDITADKVSFCEKATSNNTPF